MLHNVGNAFHILAVKILDNSVRFKVFTAVTMKIASSRMLRSVALVRTDVSEELSASIIRVTRIVQL
jgi:hypothetical protein